MSKMLSSMLLLSFMASCFIIAVSAGNFKEDCQVTWGHDRARILERDQLLTLSLDNYSGSGFESQKEYLFGRIDMKIKLVAGDSAGTVTTYYLSSQGITHDEVDFEFLGNVSGQPYTIHTNVFAQGKGDREQQFHLWFDPTADFHTYSIDWHPKRITFLIDDSPIRVFHNNQSQGVSFPTNQPMKVYSSLWNADDWATQGGRVKTNWAFAPFTASYRDFKVTPPTDQELDLKGRERMRWVDEKFMIYNYCTDLKRFPQGLPRECKR